MADRNMGMPRSAMRKPLPCVQCIEERMCYDRLTDAMVRQRGGMRMEVSLRLRPLLNQFVFARDRLLARVAGMTDAEYLREPVPGCWSIRPRGDIPADRAYGGGPWVVEFTRPEPDPPPFTTLAWRLCHLASGMLQRADYTVGAHAMTRADYVVPATAVDGIASLTTACAAWH